MIDLDHLHTGDAHSRWCVLYCTGDHCTEHHECWCVEGGLSAAEFAERHPLWLKLPAMQWLDTDEGSQWQTAMDDLS